VIQRIFSKYSSSRRFASDLLQFCLQIQEQFCNKTFPGEKKYLPETPEADSGRCIFSGDP
jgi:hypothetical protein